MLTKSTALWWRMSTTICHSNLSQVMGFDRDIGDGIGKWRLFRYRRDPNVRLFLRFIAIEYFTHSAQQFLLSERLLDEVGLRSQRLTTFAHVRVARHV